MCSKLKLYSSKMTVCLHDIHAKAIMLPIRPIIGQVQAMKAIPKMLTRKRGSLVGMKADQVDEESLSKHIDLSGIQEWYIEDQEAARSLIKEFSCIFFLRNDLDLWRTTVVKHKSNSLITLHSKYIIGTYLQRYMRK